MATGLSVSAANSILDAIGNATSYSVATPYIQLHTASPGSAGTTSIAQETTRKLVSFGAAASGSMANDAAITWVAITATSPTTEDATHFTIWTASSGGTFVGSGTITANSYTGGDTYNIAIGAATLSFTTAS